METNCCWMSMNVLFYIFVRIVSKECTAKTLPEVAVELESFSSYTLYLIARYVARWCTSRRVLGHAQRMNIARQHVLGLSTVEFYLIPWKLVLWPSLVLSFFIFNSQVHEMSVFLQILIDIYKEQVSVNLLKSWNIDSRSTEFIWSQLFLPLNSLLDHSDHRLVHFWGLSHKYDS